MQDFSVLCVRKGEFLLPGEETDMQAFSVIACDQFTAQPDYWVRIRDRIEGKPSALQMILPECWLSKSSEQIPKIHEMMRAYLRDGVLSKRVNGMILLRRTTASGSRLGLVACADLEQYGYLPGSLSPIRATEATISQRIPARLQIRESAPLELSHILLLADDPSHSLIEPAFAARDDAKKLYDFELMENGGHLEGWALDDPQALNSVLNAISDLTQKAGKNGIVFAVGDGNHSLAAARAHWLKIRDTLSAEERETHPARFAMVEIVNIYDEALHFEPIHRVLFHVNAAKVRDFLAPCAPVLDFEKPELILVHQRGDLPLRLTKPLNPLTVASVQTLLDANTGFDLDYIHGEAAVRTLVMENDAVGILLPAMEKSTLFPAVRALGVLPRKTFSMGEANEKRYYVESRRIVEESVCQ